MNREKIKKAIYGNLKNNHIEEEFQRRYKTRNLFRPNAGPPIKYKGIKKKALEIKEKDSQEQEPIEEQEVCVPNDSPEEKIQICISDELSREKSLEVSKEVHSLEEKLQSEKLLRVSESYERGDNIWNELLAYFHSNKLCGKDSKYVLEEDENCILAPLAASAGLSVLIMGRSRSGKSLIMDKLIEILTSVYHIKVCSNKALFGNSETINKHDFIYITEYQAVICKNPAVKESIKNVTENKDATNDSNGEVQFIKGDLSVLTTGTKENKNIRDMDVEVAGRFSTLKTSSSEGLHPIIHNSQKFV